MSVILHLGCRMRNPWTVETLDRGDCALNSGHAVRRSSIDSGSSSTRFGDVSVQSETDMKRERGARLLLNDVDHPKPRAIQYFSGISSPFPRLIAYVRYQDTCFTLVEFGFTVIRDGFNRRRSGASWDRITASWILPHHRNRRPHCRYRTGRLDGGYRMHAKRSQRTSAGEKP